MTTSGNLKRALAISLTVGVLACLGTGVWHIVAAERETSNPSAKTGQAFVAGELLKASVAFVLIVVGGTLVKLSVDTTVERERELRAESHREDERRRADAHREDERRRVDVQRDAERRRDVVNEFVAVYSGFYAARKLYHSALSDSNDIFDKAGEDFACLRRSLLKNIVDLEGRYGAVKISAITSFGLPAGFLGAKNVKEVRAQLDIESDPPRRVRLMLDLLGEAYDDWRHALEERRKIDMIEDVWATYDKLLQFFQTAPIIAEARERPGA